MKILKRQPSRLLIGSGVLVGLLLSYYSFALTDTSKTASNNQSSAHALLEPSDDQSQTATDIAKILQTRHYIDQQVDDALSSRLLDNYLEDLDSTRATLLAADIKEFERFRYTLDDGIKSGDLEPGYFIFRRYQERLENRLEKIIKDLPEMAAAFDFDKEESLTLDRSTAPWPKNEAESDDIWRKIVKNRVLSLKLAGKTEDDVIPTLQKRFKFQLDRIRQTNSEDVFSIYMNSLTELYDPHTNYLSPSISENFNINMSLSLEGIGAVLQKEDEYTKVVRLVHAGPAQKQGQLQPSDRIVAVAQGSEGDFLDVIGLRLDEVVKLIRGEKDTMVRLEVIPVDAKSEEERKTIQIVRNTVKLEEQSAQKDVIEIFNGQRAVKIGVIDVPAFYIDFAAQKNGDPEYKSTTRDVSRLLNELVEKDHVEGIIIDLRDNGGGSLQEANSLIGLFIDSGPTVQIRHSSKRVFPNGKRNSTKYYDGPLAVVINRLSASASEIFAGAIQDYQRGIVVGEQSFGKGTVQSLTPLRHGELKITESKFYRISGESTQNRGVIPDIQYPAIYDKSKVGESSLDNALTWDRIDSMRYPKYFNIQSIIDELKTKHSKRGNTDPDFIFMQEQIAIAEQSANIKSISLNEAERRVQRDSDKTKLRAIENKRRVSKGLEPLKADDPSLDEDSEDDTDASASTETTESIDKMDPLLLETGNILIDASDIFNRERIALGK